MARIRTVKPGYFTDPDVTAVSIPARLLLVSMWTQADDDGRLLDQPRLLCANAFGDEDRVNPERLVAELAAGREPRVVRYTVDGKRYIQIHGFRKHQVISKYRKSPLPPPPSVPEDSSPPPGDVQSSSREEWNGMEEEGNGRESLSPTSHGIARANGEQAGEKEATERLHPKTARLLRPLIGGAA